MPAALIDGNGINDIINNIAQLFTVNANPNDVVNIFDPTVLLGGFAGILTVLKVALSAPLIALYQISAEVLIMIALIMFISYIGKLIGVDVFGFVDERYLTGSADSGYTAFSSSGYAEDPVYPEQHYRKRSADQASFLSNPTVAKLTERVYAAFEKYAQ